MPTPGHPPPSLYLPVKTSQQYQTRRLLSLQLACNVLSHISLIKRVIHLPLLVEDTLHMHNQ